MKISNFKLVKVGGDTVYSALWGTVEVTTGFLWFKKTVTKGIFKEEYGDYWRWEDTGSLTPRLVVEDLAKAYVARKGETSLYRVEC